MPGNATESSPLLTTSGRRSGNSWSSTPIDPLETKLPLAGQCFIAGLADCISFSTSKTWIAFMTGNLTQVALSAVGVLHSDELHDPKEHAEMRSRLMFSGFAISGFCLGAFLTSRFRAADERQRRQRLRLVALTSMHVLITALVVLLLTVGVVGAHPLRLSHDPILALLLALSMGSQSSMSISLGAHPYSTTVVFTNPLTQLCSDRYIASALVPFTTARNRQESSARHRAASIGLLLLGAIVGAFILEWMGVLAAMGALLGCQVAVALAWATFNGEGGNEDDSH